MRHIQEHQAHCTMEDCFLALEVGHDQVHGMLVKVVRLLSDEGVISRTELPLVGW